MRRGLTERQRMRVVAKGIDRRVERLRADGLETLAESSAALHGPSLRAVLGQSRLARVVMARREVAAALYSVGHSLGAVAEYLGIDHTSVLHALKMAGVKRRPACGKKAA